MRRREIKCEKRGKGKVCTIFQKTKKVGYDRYNKRPVYLNAEVKEYKNLPKKNFQGRITRNYKTLSISGHSRDFAGQIHDTITDKEQVKLTIPEQKVKKIVSTWKRWHLNDLKAGTKKQEDALKKMKGKYDYDKAVKFLKKKKLYSDKGYKYGTDWLVEPLPESVASNVEKLFED